ncbi:hypothetical protein GEV33_011125 [Tenebrio molitor]|uniref:Endonuclease/exonuclease/phosphatase domain-containing protein n=1 Tax=Tenebrio molitor TaxID=7067 RepID=A0A8J6HC64_TENMO|nr:hypothetical protein GEV33_011125 [Tenebrio molitor]
MQRRWVARDVGTAVIQKKRAAGWTGETYVACAAKKGIPTEVGYAEPLGNEKARGSKQVKTERKKNTVTLTMLQVNLNRSRAAHELLKQTATEMNFDILLVAEPNVKLTEKEHWQTSRAQDAAIKVINKNVKVTNAGGGNGFAWIEFGKILHSIQINLRGQTSRRFIVAGDLNTKSGMWGSPTDDRRGEILVEWLAGQDLHVLNTGGAPTFVRGASNSYIDVTFCSENLTSKIKEWTVLDVENLSDHQYICFKIAMGGLTASIKKDLITVKGWKVTKEGMEVVLSNNLSKESRFGMPDQNTSGTCEEILRSVCDRSLQRKRNFGERKKAVYWWSEEIASLRKKRELVRGNGKNITVEERKVLQMRYVAQKSTLRKAITAAKDKAWKDLCAEVDKDVWCDGYKIVLKKFKTFPKIQLSKEKKLQRPKSSPTGERRLWQIRPLEEKDITSFTSKELEEAASKLKLGKAPGPDAFPPEVIKALIENLPQYCLQLMNRLLNAVVFSILLYGAPIWEHAMKVERFRNYLERIVRQNAARVSSAYRTASTEALEVIAGFPPIDLLVAERTRVYEEGRESRPDSRKCYYGGQ